LLCAAPASATTSRTTGNRVNKGRLSRSLDIRIPIQAYPTWPKQTASAVGGG
jgi:hypothetical protein